MKKCCICKQEKNLGEFNKNKTKKDGLNGHCRDCSKIKSKNFYHTNKKHHIQNIYKNRKKYTKIIKTFINKIKNKCSVCEEKEPCCLDFHHLEKKEKEHNIAKLNACISLKKIIKEIKKCAVVCSNCHRKIHNEIIKETFTAIKLPELKTIKDLILFCKQTKPIERSLIIK